MLHRPSPAKVEEWVNCIPCSGLLSQRASASALVSNVDFAATLPVRDLLEY
jgi:hypothetical protein